MYLLKYYYYVYTLPLHLLSSSLVSTTDNCIKILLNVHARTHVCMHACMQFRNLAIKTYFIKSVKILSSGISHFYQIETPTKQH